MPVEINNDTSAPTVEPPAPTTPTVEPPATTTPTVQPPTIDPPSEFPKIVASDKVDGQPKPSAKGIVTDGQKPPPTNEVVKNGQTTQPAEAASTPPPVSKRYRNYTIYSIIAVVGLSLILFANHEWHSRATVYFWRTVPVERGNLTLLVTATGAMAADTSVDIGVQVSGIIANIKSDFNDVVKKGQVIAVLDTTLYYAAKLDAVATLQRAEVARTEAQIEYNRSKNLFDNQVAAKADFDLAKTALKNADGNVTSARAQLKKAAINLQYCTITAPISGVIVSRNVQLGNMVIASFSSPVLYTIAYDLTKMQVQANVDEADIGQIKVGQKSKFTVESYPSEVFEGIVTQIRHQPITLQNVVNYVVIIEVPNPKLKLIPGMTANANILIQERKNVLKVATNAFTFTPPVEYILASKTLDDSTKKFWQARIRANEILKKQEIVDVNGKSGYLWAVKDKDIYPVLVNKGLNDGTFTEISGGNLLENNAVATGINLTETKTDAKATNSPFMPKFPTKKK